ncbi:vacuolar protein sorting-associated protein 17 [Monosporozyma unispora]|nr:Vacuolar protein sorting-associated protein 17 [Kazachstania unispora]
MTSSVPYFNADEMEHNPFEDNQGSVIASTILTHGNTKAEEEEEDVVATPPAEHTISIDTPIETPPHVSPPPQSIHEEQVKSPPSPPRKDDPQSIDKFLPEIKFQSKHHFKVKVTGLERVGTNSNKRENPTIIFQYDTNIPLFRRKHCDKVKKTIQEFKEFYKYLNSCVLECFVPTLPLPYTHYGINNQEDYEEVLLTYQIWFNRIVKDPIIVSNEEFMFFIESDFNTYRPINHGQGNDDHGVSLTRYEGIKRKTMKQFQPPYDNNVILSEFRPMIKSLYRGSQIIQDCMLVIDKIHGLAIQEETTLGKEFIQLNSMINQFYKFDDVIPPYERYGKILITVSDINSVLSTMNMATLYDGLSWVISDTYGIKESLTDRHFIMRDLMNLQKQSKLKQERARKNRNKRDIDPLRLNESIHDLQNTIKLEQRTTLKLTRMTMNMTESREQWLKWYDDWIKLNIKNFTLKNIEYERKKLNVMERAKYGIRSTDSQGGLSRLGRDHLPVLSPEAHKSVIKPSQERDNDTWTTTDRHFKDTNELIKSTSRSQSAGAVELLKPAETQEDNTNYNARTAVRFLGRANF